MQDKLNTILYALPNMPVEEVPAGLSEDDNVEIRKWGTPREFDFMVRDHVELGERSNELDFEVATKLTGSRFAVMRGQLARMNRALIQFMLNTHIEEHCYEEIYVPDRVNRVSLFGTDQLPNSE